MYVKKYEIGLISITIIENKNINVKILKFVLYIIYFYILFEKSENGKFALKIAIICVIKILVNSTSYLN